MANITIIPLKEGKNFGICPGKYRLNNKNNKKRCEICSKLTIKTSDQRH